MNLVSSGYWIHYRWVIDLYDRIYPLMNIDWYGSGSGYCI